MKLLNKIFLATLVFVLCVNSLAFAGDLNFSSQEEFDAACDYQMSKGANVRLFNADKQQYSFAFIEDGTKCKLIEAKNDLAEVLFYINMETQTANVDVNSLQNISTGKKDLIDEKLDSVNALYEAQDETAVSQTYGDDDEDEGQSSQDEITEDTPQNKALSKNPISKALASFSASIIDEEGADVYVAPFTTAETISTIDNGKPVTVSNLGIAWCEIPFNGGYAYIQTSKIDFEDGNDFVMVNAPRGTLTLRKETSIKSTVLKKYTNGIVGIRLEEDNGFTKISLAGKVGYMLSDHLLEVTAVQNITGTATIIYPGNPDKDTVINLRCKETKESALSAKVNTKTTVTLIEENGEWSELEVNGIHGYMMSKFVEVE